MEIFKKEDLFLVTGASSGLGRGVAQTLVAQGATVVGIARNADRLAETQAGCKALERFHAEVKDLAEDVAGLPAYVKSLKDKYGKFRGLAYCAGITDVSPLQSLDDAGMRRLFEIDYFAPVMMAKGFADRRVNAGRGAAMVFIASIAAMKCDKGHGVYGGAKAALTASCKSFAHELAPLGLRVNTLSPSEIMTPLVAAKQTDLAALAAEYPFGFGDVADVAELAAFLLSDKAKWITGQNYVADCASF